MEPINSQQNNNAPKPNNFLGQLSNEIKKEANPEEKKTKQQKKEDLKKVLTYGPAKILF